VSAWSSIAGLTAVLAGPSRAEALRPHPGTCDNRAMGEQPQRFGDLTLDEFLARLGSAEPVPGGGSASAIAAALAAALVTMVARLSRDRAKYAAYEATHLHAEAGGQEASRTFLRLADEDAAAYGAFSAALKLPRETDDEKVARSQALRAAARGAARVPLEVVRACTGLAADIESMAGRSNLNAASDVRVAALLVEAAANGAAANVLVNLPSVGDAEFEVAVTDEVMGHLRVIDDLAARAREVAGSGHLRDPEAR